jgi:hypothetical protein
MQALIGVFRDLRALPGAFVDSGFGHTLDGRPVFMPFGEWGRSYIVDTPEMLARMRKQLSWILILPCIAVLATFSLYFKPIRESALVPVLMLMGGSFAIFMIVFFVWAWANTRSMSTLEEDETSIPIQNDPLEAGAASIRSWLESHAGEVRSADMFSIAGGLAGFACQMVVRNQAQAEQRRSDLNEIALNDGRLLYFGDALNRPLVEDAVSVWSIVGDGTPVAAIQPMFEDAIVVLTSEPPLPAVRSIAAAVQHLWPTTAAILDVNEVPATSRHLAIARAVRAMQSSQGELTLEQTSRIVLRSAILMSRWDPADILAPKRETDRDQQI